MSKEHNYDVVVVGGGPGGSATARVTAKEGAKTILLEEHPQIGLPEHCMGVLATPSDTFLDELIKKIEQVIPEVENEKVKLLLNAVLSDERRHHDLLTAILEIVVKEETITEEDWWDILWKNAVII